MSNPIAQNMFNTIQTKQKANDFLRLFDQIEGLSHHTDVFNIEEVLSIAYNGDMSDWVVGFVKNMPDLMSGKVSVEDIGLLKEVRDMVENAIVVKIEVNFSPSSEFIENVIRKFSENYDGMNFILDVDVTEDVESGAMFYIEGNVIDLTVRKQVTSYLVSQDVVNRYL